MTRSYRGYDLVPRKDPHERPLPRRRAWLGGGIGLERATLQVTAPDGSSGDLTLNGYDLFLQGGLDWEVSPSFFVGPWAQLAVGKYSELQIEAEGQSMTLELANKTWHEWLSVGVRGRFDL